jgi:hypothetical protein
MRRRRDQVKTFNKYGYYKEGMSVGEVLEQSRSDRLVKKELEKNTSGVILDLTEGNLENQLVTLPNIDWKSDQYKIRGGNVIEIADRIEQSFNLITQ